MNKAELTGYPSIDKPWLKYYSEEVRNAKVPACSMYDLLYGNNCANTGDIAVEYMGNKVTYGRLFGSRKGILGMGNQEGRYSCNLRGKYTGSNLFHLCTESHRSNCKSD